ncbi:hypothetical protein LTR17_005470 [Elasticomyces elasticus]|nr:hypothetical protein LTR17_005470 [Elasticomyces elasticus]
MVVAQSRLAWALQVDVAALVAHLETEVWRESAYITKLPVELIDIVAEFLADAKVAYHEPQLVKAKAAYQCWLKECSPLSHLSDDTKASLICRMVENGNIPGDHTNDMVNESMRDRPESWCDEHVSRRKEWQRTVGEPCNKSPYSSYSLLSWHEDFMRDSYGLEIFVMHRQLGNCRYDTLAYLTLPASREYPPPENRIFKNTRWVDHGPEWGHETERVSHSRCPADPSVCCTGEDAIAHAVDMPPTPTVRERGLFARMERLLGQRSEELILDRVETSYSQTGDNGRQYLRKELQLMLLTRLQREGW